ncbi:MAG: ATP-binding protein [Lachnospiraceae bacterium]|nr:ATP-binding protein [Lachnospiraceae bacterium]
MEPKDRIDKDTLIRILKTIPSNIFFKDTEEKYVFSSHNYRQMGLGEDNDIYGKTDRDIRSDSSNIEQIENMDKEILESGIGKRYVLKSDIFGEVRYSDIIKEPVKDDNGNTIGIVGLVNDVTMATRELSNMLENEKAYQKAMRAGAFLAYNVNLSKDILIDDLKELVDGVELDLLAMLNMKAPCKYSEFIEKWANKMLVEKYRDKFIKNHSPQRLISLYKNGEIEVAKELNIEIMGKDGNNQEIWMNESILLMENVENEVIAFITLKNVSKERLEERQLKQQLEAAAKEAKAANEAKDRILANTSHEIRTPMNTIVGMAEVLLRDETDEKKIEYLNNIKNAGEHLLEIVKDILDFSKIESGKVEMVPAIYDIRARIDALEKLLRERIGNKNIDLLIDVDENIPKYLYGDATRIRQVIINLVNNSIKFTKDGFIKFTVKMLEMTDSEITEYVSVEDSGIGIKEEDIDKLFSAFNRLDRENTANIEGTGLGLAISKQFIELMGGEIKVESKYGIGTKFSFTIKQGLVREQDIKKNDEIKSVKDYAGRPFKAPKAKILLAEDNVINVKVFKALVAPTKIQIDVAENGKIATEMVERNDYDLVLMDHMMPVMDGIEATEAIRHFNSDKRDIKIIALTANAVVGMKEQFLEAGMNDFMTKPIQIKELLAMLRMYLPEEYIEEDMLHELGDKAFNSIRKHIGEFKENRMDTK